MSWRAQVEAALAHGERFAAAWVSGDAWRAAFTLPGSYRVLSCPVSDAESIVDLVGAAEWDEREAGIAGRPLVDHPETGWTTTVSGDGVHQVAVGPIHAGIIESGHFRFHVVGDRVLVMDPRLFYKHRGLEKAAEGRTLEDALAVAGRACAACAVANTVAYAQAVEDALGLWPDRALRVNRTLLLELERLYNHLHDIGALCSGVGFAPGAMAFAALKERAQRLNVELCGHRFLFGTVAIGRGGVEVEDPSWLRAALRSLHADAAAAWREIEFAASVQARLDGVGVLDRHHAERLGAVGPAARAAGVRRDVREDSPRLRYGGFAPARPREETGDVAARAQVRAAELEATCELLDDLLSEPITVGSTSARDEPSGLGFSRVESPRGATACVVEQEAGRVTRLRLRTGSYANWPAVAHAAAGCLLPDFPLINKSFELCYACVDR
jgi:Ni,Fe-hydrogenase III large subunit